MKRLGDIDAFFSTRPTLSQQEREKLERERLQQHKEDGYQRLAELCRLGEYDAAKQLTLRNPSWGYEIADGVVVERSD